MQGIQMNEMVIKNYNSSFEKQVIDLWFECGLIVPWNNPKRDIERKMDDDPSLFFICEIGGRITGSCMAGYDGHRGWIYYLAVKPEFQKQGIASKLIREAESRLLKIGCPKINLMVRKSNEDVISFYRRIGYKDDPVVVLSKKLYKDEPYKRETS
jgi:ribosomal protein S18 acetylase RimI-like enzyme